VLGHEIAHTTHRHGYRGYKDQQKKQSLSGLGSMLAGVLVGATKRGACSPAAVPSPRVGRDRVTRHRLAWISRPFRGCGGRAFVGYSWAKRAISSFEMFIGAFNTNHVTFSLQGGVVSEPMNV
jgi:hypothetical protein